METRLSCGRLRNAGSFPNRGNKSFPSANLSEWLWVPVAKDNVVTGVNAAGA
jgi:hypothetical protein